jgi:hypothetical protein
VTFFLSPFFHKVAFNFNLFKKLVELIECYHFCRSRLSYEQFSAFLANIKELNAQKQTREVNKYWG